MIIKVDIAQQYLFLMDRYATDAQIIAKYPVSTAKNGVGEEYGSEKTPRGWHQIYAKVGKDCLPNTVFVGREATGEIFEPTYRSLFPERDWILTRILWLKGIELGKNSGGTVDTLRRYIYIHGTPDDVALRIPGSRGCVRMHNHDIISLFDQVKVGDRVLIQG